ncbi:MarR family winged helix-turn-helix transcriptional regulator [Chromobacterium sp. IIBBL 290-4]|uniref:MarR family winged helix-turn-helix transcriptional regulator n=1 Tax=Chromobacterium sp. IIBBL 290-4 TaxID=2953890 RepID=UPI0020B88516|nr:MarR family winged helix-turn-helix transcriptional regulator [Chromobacterium sp. IIBBL 290-4]UTH75159.1 MarR family winged helix-turn-helix transcriptional regulator [Chromobacterium sp. IIBBL 290-4]
MNSNQISHLQAHLGYWMRMVSNRVSEEFQRGVEASGVSVSEWVALRVLYDQSNTTHGSLTQTLGMTKGAISKIVSRLEDKQLIERSVDDGDARLVVLALTPAGRALVPRLAQIADENDQRFFGHLSEAQQAQLRELLESIVRQQQLTEIPVR